MFFNAFSALLAIFIPILVIEEPSIKDRIDMGISGTYDVLVLSFLLPQDQVLQLLPLHLQSQNNLLNVPDNVRNRFTTSQGISSGTGRMHPVLLQMGYQINTGPGPTWLPKFSFNECKLEVPFVRHPSGKSKLPLSFKQNMIFSNPVIKMGSSFTGLHSSTTQFIPSTTPHHAEKGEAQIRYTASNFVDATATKSTQASTASWSIYRDMMESWWFGGGTGNVLQKFNFDWKEALIQPEAYDIQAEINLASFISTKSELPTITVQGLGWRTRVVVSSVSCKAGEEESSKAMQ